MKKLFLFVIKFFLGFILLVLILIALAYRPDISPEKLISKYSDEDCYFLNVDGINMHVRVKGRGEALFLIHGSFSSLHTWEEWENELSQYFMTVSMDLPGHGLTGPDIQKRYGIKDYSDLLFTVANQLGLDQFHLAGNSMGGAVAMVMASEQPDKVLSLNLVNAAGAPSVARTDTTQTRNSSNSGAWIFKVIQNPIFNSLLLKCTPRFLFKQNLKDVFYDDSRITDAMLDRYYELLRREGNRRATLDRLTIRRPYKIDYEKLTMPVLVMWGKYDNWIPVRNGERLKSAIPEAKLLVFEDAGHVPMEEIPTDTVAEYLSFLGIQADRDYFAKPRYYSLNHGKLPHLNFARNSEPSDPIAPF